MKYYIGIDGGGSKTELLLCNECGEVLTHLITKGSNPASVGVEKAIKNIEKLINASLKNIDKKHIEYICICVPGLKNHANLISVLKEFKGKYMIMGDELNAFYGSLGQEKGIVVLSGTGSFAMGINSEGKMCTIGGWGPISGDEGSGYYMGMQALKAVMKNYDGMGEDTVLSTLIKETLNIESINDLKRVLYKEDFGVRDIAALSRLVKEGAEKKDFVCNEIIKDSSNKLFNLVEGVIERLRMRDEDYDLCLTGGISNFGELILNPLKKLIENRYSNIHIKKPKYIPVVGSIMICFKHTTNNCLPKNIEMLNKSLKDVDVSVI